MPAGIEVSPQLFSCLHHYQVPHVVDLPVQLVIVLLGMVLRSPVGNLLPFQALGCGSPNTPTGTTLCVACLYGSALSWGPGCVPQGKL